MNLWVNHPRTKQPSPSITFSVWTLIVILIKALASGVVAYGITFGELDSGLVAALLAPTLGALVASKHIDINGGRVKPASKDE